MQKMLSKSIRIDCLLACALLCLTCVSGASFPQYCSECEQEVWEEVPCSDIPKTTSTTQMPPITKTPKPTLPPPLTTTARPLPPLPTTMPPQPTPSIICGHAAAAIAPQLQESKSFRKCYCDCKLGCKEFCRKVAYAAPSQQITQMTATAENVPGAQMEITHLLQRKVYASKPQADLQPYVIEQTPPTAYSQPLTVDTSYPTATSAKIAKYYNMKPADTYAASPVAYAPVIGEAVAPVAPQHAHASANARSSGSPSARQSYNAMERTTSGNYVAKGSYSGYVSTTPYPVTSFDNAIDSYLHDYVYGNRDREEERQYTNY